MEESIMVLKESQPYLAKLAKLAPKLNEETDRYTAELREIEATLAKMNLGIEVELDNTFLRSSERKYVDLKDEEHRSQEGFSLGYGRYGDSWCILVHQDEYEIRPNEEWNRIESKPLLDCARHIRVAAASAIPSLLEKLVEDAENKIESLQKVSDR